MILKTVPNGIRSFGRESVRKGDIFQVLCSVWFSQSTTRVGQFVKNPKVKGSKCFGEGLSYKILFKCVLRAKIGSCVRLI